MLQSRNWIYSVIKLLYIWLFRMCCSLLLQCVAVCCCSALQFVVAVRCSATQLLHSRYWIYFVKSLNIWLLQISNTGDFREFLPAHDVWNYDAHTENNSISRADFQDSSSDFREFREFLPITQPLSPLSPSYIWIYYVHRENFWSSRADFENFPLTFENFCPPIPHLVFSLAHICLHLLCTHRISRADFRDFFFAFQESQLANTTAHLSTLSCIHQNRLCAHSAHRDEIPELTFENF